MRNLMSAALLGGLLLVSSASSAGQPGPGPGDSDAAAHALYLAQQHAYAGQMTVAAQHLGRAVGARPACTVLVSVSVQGGVVPLCARDTLRVPAAVARQIAGLKARAASAPAADATLLLDQALALDPFDGPLVSQLAGALRRTGQDARADQVVTAHAERSRVRLLWAGR